MEPPIRYATSTDGVRIAFWALGSGYPLIQLPAPSVSHLEKEWRSPDYRAWFEDLAESFMLVRYDGRGLGLSDRECDDLTMEAALNDLQAVVSALGLDSFAIFAGAVAAPVAIEFAARNPSATHLVLWHPVARGFDFFNSRERRALITLAKTDWDMYSLTSATANRGWEPSESTAIEASRVGSSGQKFFLRVVEAQKGFDATESLKRVSARTLVLHHRDYRAIDIANSRFIAEQIPDATLEVLEGASGLYLGDAVIPGMIRNFLEEATVGNVPKVTLNLNRQSSLSDVTVRETEVLGLVSGGFTNADISLKLGISVHTVERHLANVYEKWGIHNRVELVLEFLRRSRSGQVA